MLEIFNDINPLILDVVVIALFVLITFFGVIRGVKSTIIDFVLLAVSIALGFLPYTNDLKEAFIGIFKVNEWLPAGSSNVALFGASLFSSLFTSTITFLLFYGVLHAIVALIAMFIRKKKKAAKKPKKVVSRVFGGIISLIYQGVIVVVALLTLNNNIVGMKNFIGNSLLSSVIVDKTEELIDNIEVGATDAIVIKIYNGNLMQRVTKEDVKSFNYFDDKFETLILNKKYLTNLEDVSVTNDEARKMIKERIIDLYNLAIISDSFDDNNKGLKEDFSKLAEEWLGAMNKKVKENYLGKVELTMNEYGNIKIALEKAGLKEQLMDLYIETFEGK